MKQLVVGTLWAISIGVAFYIGKGSVSPERIVETQEIIKVKEKIITKNNSEKLLVSSKSKESKKDKDNSQDVYYQKRFDFLTKDGGRDETKIDCRDGKRYACWKLEEYYRLTGQKKKLLNHMQGNCDGKKVKSCVNLYYMLDDKKSKARITSNLKKECKDNNAKACVSLGNIVEYGEAKIDKMAFKLREKGCELDVKTCSSLASSLNRVNDPRAGEFYLKACEAGGEHACMSASRFFLEKGQKDEAGQALQLACDQKENYECRQYYDFLLANKRLDEAEVFKNRACESDKTKDFFNCKIIN